MIFEDQEEFQEAIRYLFTPEVFSLFKGEYMKDRWAEFKLGLIVILYGLLMVVEYGIISAVLTIF